MSKEEGAGAEDRLTVLTKRLETMAMQLVNVSNRQHAMDCMFHSMLQLMDIHSLQHLAREYDEAIDRLATQLPPNLQRPYIWKDLEQSVQERLRHLQSQQAKEKRDGA